MKFRPQFSSFTIGKLEITKNQIIFYLNKIYLHHKYIPYAEIPVIPRIHLIIKKNTMNTKYSLFPKIPIISKVKTDSII